MKYKPELNSGPFSELRQQFSGIDADMALRRQVALKKAAILGIIFLDDPTKMTLTQIEHEIKLVMPPKLRN